MTNFHPDLGKPAEKSYATFPFLPSPLFHSQLVQQCKVFVLKRVPPKYKLKPLDPT